MQRANIRCIRSVDDPALHQLPALFEAMHHGMEAQGMQLKLAPDGASKWVEDAARSAERFGRLVVAERDGTVVGFAHGAVKLAPEHLGGARLGHITHVFVDPASRGQGLGKDMVAELRSWFTAKEVASIELQVVVGNEEGLRFWRSMGFAVELLQMRNG